jgi:hypothetical protein
MRRLGFAVGAMSMAVAACGRIVTLPTNNGVSIPSGDMSIRFGTLGPLNFSSFYYVVIFNTSGNGVTPLASSLTSYANYSFALVFGGNGVTGAQYQLLQVISTGSSAGFTTRAIPINPLYVTSFNANSNSQGTQFTFVFNRLLLLTVPNPTSSATPSPSPSASPTATPSSVATSASTPSPSPAPSATPTISPGTSTLWAMNFFSTDTSFNPIDAISNNGVNDTSFSYVVNTLDVFDTPVNKPNPPPVTVSNQSAQVMVIEVINNP